jgi:hypothetical protein
MNTIKTIVVATEIPSRLYPLPFVEVFGSMPVSVFINHRSLSKASIQTRQGKDDPRPVAQPLTV